MKWELPVCLAASPRALLVANVVERVVTPALTASTFDISPSVQAVGMRLVVRCQARRTAATMVGMITRSMRRRAKLVSFIHEQIL